MDSDEKESEESQHSAVKEDDMFEETIIDLKQEKSRYKTAFTRTRRRLLVLIQRLDVTIEQIDEASDQLNIVMDEALQCMGRLANKYKVRKDSKSNEKLGSEIELIEEEFTNAQNRAQKVRDELSERLMHSKFVGGLNKEPSLLGSTSVVHNLPMQVGSGMLNKATEVSTVTQVERAASNLAEKQFNKQLPVPMFTTGTTSQIGMETSLMA